MGVFKKYEEQVLDLLTASVLSRNQLESVKNDGVQEKYEYTGCGYYLDVKHPCLPIERIVCDDPLIVGNAGSFEAGFVIFIEKGELTLECHDWGGIPGRKTPATDRVRNGELAPCGQ